jgi:hypothetical protein
MALTCSTHEASASAVGSIVRWPRSFIQVMHSAIQSAWCSIASTTLVNAVGLPAPAMVKRFGKPATVIRRWPSAPIAFPAARTRLRVWSRFSHTRSET